MGELTLQVGGMGCRRCVREVTARLRDVPGVETVAADAARSVVRLGGSMTAEAVLGALTGTTFRVAVVDNSGTTEAGQGRSRGSSPQPSG
jgi:copper chaperone CopZ